MRKMKDSGIEWIGEIPEEWNVEKNRHCFDLTKEIVGDLSTTTELLSLTTKGVRLKSATDTAGKVPETYDTYQFVHINDLIMCLFDLDCSAVFSGLSLYEGMISPAYKILKTKTNTNPNYAKYWFQFVFDGRKFMSYSKTLRYTLTYEEFGFLPVLLPDLNDQICIASYLDTQCAHIDNIIEKTKASIEEYKKLKQAVITQAVTKGVRGDRPMKDSGIEWIGEIPEEWEILKVRYIGTLQNGISKGSEFFGDGFPFVSYGDIYKNYSLPSEVSGLVQTSDDERNLYSVQKGDIFFTRTSETIEEVGFSSVCFKTIPNATFAGFVIRLRPYKVNESVLTEYAKYYFRGEQIRRYLVKEMNLVTRASLGQGLLNAMTVLIPQKQEQQEIAAYLDKKCDEIDAIITKKQQFITEMESYKKSLIFECVTGKREVK